MNNNYIKVEMGEIYKPSFLTIDTGKGNVKKIKLEKMTNKKKTNLMILYKKMEKLKLELEDETKTEEEKLEKNIELLDKTYDLLSIALAPLTKNFFEEIQNEEALVQFVNYAGCYIQYGTLDKYDEYKETERKLKETQKKTQNQQKKYYKKKKKQY